MALLPFHSEQLIEVGCDEVGRGCLAGPVVAAAVLLPPNYAHPEIKDSKQLSKKMRLSLQLDIQKHALCWGIGVVQNTEIDRLNILNATFLSMHRAIESLSIQPELLLIDGNRFSPYKNIEHLCVVGGDNKYLSIAAASILAKNYRDALMNELHDQYPLYAWNKNKGYPTVQHRAAIREHGTTPYHRHSFTLLAKK